jgi:hypothetical protein
MKQISIDFTSGTIQRMLFDDEGINETFKNLSPNI